jgi:hypothetical protein
MLCACGNAARYVNARGELCCGTCPLKEGIDSVKIRAIPDLLAWVRSYLRGDDRQTDQVLREIIGKDASKQ